MGFIINVRRYHIDIYSRREYQSSILKEEDDDNARIDILITICCLLAVWIISNGRRNRYNRCCSLNRCASILSVDLWWVAMGLTVSRWLLPVSLKRVHFSSISIQMSEIQNSLLESFSKQRSSEVIPEISNSVHLISRMVYLWMCDWERVRSWLRLVVFFRRFRRIGNGAVASCGVYNIIWHVWSLLEIYDAEYEVDFGKEQVYRDPVT